MTHPNLDLIDAFFEAYGKRDRNALQRVLAENITWVFMGRHPLSGVRKGIDEVIGFFDTMGTLMSKSNSKAERLIISANDNYVIECQHVWTNREDGHNLDHMVCVLWKFENGKIVEGKHFFANPQAADEFFDYVVTAK